MPSLLHSTLNTRPLPTGDFRFIRSDCPDKLTDEEVQWLLQNNVTTVIDVREQKEYERKPCRSSPNDRQKAKNNPRLPNVFFYRA